MRKLSVFFIILLLFPAAVKAAPVDARTQLIGAFFVQNGCLDCSALAANLAGTGATSPAKVTHTTATPLSNSPSNDLLPHLQTLFVLDSLFRNDGSGLVTPGPVTLANIIVLYEIFYGPRIP